MPVQFATIPQNPLISVIISVYNGDKFLSEALESLLTQSYSHLEVVIVNDGSTDGTQYKLNSYAAQDSRLKVFHTTNQGPAKARNIAFSHTTGALVAVMDSDDICHPKRLEVQLKFLQENSDIALVGSYYRQINSKGHRIKSIDALPTEPESLRDYLKDRNPLCHGTMMVRREVFEALGGYREVFHQAEDYDLFLRTSEQYDIALIPEILYHHRVHGQSLSTTERLVQLQMRNFAQYTARQRRETGQDILADLHAPQQLEILQEFLKQDLMQFRKEYGFYLSDLGRKLYRIGENGAALNNLKIALSLVPIQLRAFRYYWKASFRELFAVKPKG